MITTQSYSGVLVAVEGLDGSGKSTQLSLLYRWPIQKYSCVVLTEWNSSPVLRDIIRREKKAKRLSPTLFSTLHCADFAERYDRIIYPVLQSGGIVLCDRYIFTAFVRDVARGCDPVWIRKLYSFACHPDLTMYFRVPQNIAQQRVLSRRSRPKWYEAGMDINLSADRIESFSLFQQRVSDEYDNVISEYSLNEIDATLPPKEQQNLFRATLSNTFKLKGFE